MESRKMFEAETTEYRADKNNNNPNARQENDPEDKKRNANEYLTKVKDTIIQIIVSDNTRLPDYVTNILNSSESFKGKSLTEKAATFADLFVTAETLANASKARLEKVFSKEGVIYPEDAVPNITEEKLSCIGSTVIAYGFHRDFGKYNHVLSVHFNKDGQLYAIDQMKYSKECMTISYQIKKYSESYNKRELYDILFRFLLE